MSTIPPLKVIALLLAIAPHVTACGTSKATAAGDADSLYIAVAANRRPATEAYFEGVRLAIDHLNSERPEGARPFAMRPAADSLAGAVEMATAFRDDPAVIGVVGHTGSQQTIDAAPVYGDHEQSGRRALVAVSPTSTNPAVTRASEWVFRVCPTDEDAARALARFATDSLRARGAAVIYRNDLFGRGFTRIFAPEFEQAGGIVLERNPYLAGITEYQAYAERIARRRADAVVIAGGAQDAVDIVRAMRRFGAAPRVIGTDDLAGIAADPSLAREFAGVRFTAFYLPNAGPAAVRFERDYRARFGREPEHRAALAYDAAMLIGLAAMEVGPDRRRIRDRLARIGVDAPAHTGVTGLIRFNEWGDAVGKPVLMAEVRQ